jgi:hypothetical protein
MCVCVCMCVAIISMLLSFIQNDNNETHTLTRTHTHNPPQTSHTLPTTPLEGDSAAGGFHCAGLQVGAGGFTPNMSAGMCIIGCRVVRSMRCCVQSIYINSLTRTHTNLPPRTHHYTLRSQRRAVLCHPHTWIAYYVDKRDA